MRSKKKNILKRAESSLLQGSIQRCCPPAGIPQSIERRPKGKQFVVASLLLPSIFLLKRPLFSVIISKLDYNLFKYSKNVIHNQLKTCTASLNRNLDAKIEIFNIIRAEPSVNDVWYWERRAHNRPVCSPSFSTRVCCQMPSGRPRDYRMAISLRRLSHFARTSIRSSP